MGWAWLWWLLAVAVVALWIFVVVDIVRRRHSMSAGKLAAWLILVLVLPLLGALVYVLVNGTAGGRGSADTGDFSRPGGGLGA